MNAGWADYLPVHLSETQSMYRSGALSCDVAMVQVSLPDEMGMAVYEFKRRKKIVSVLKSGAGVVTPRADVQWVVTEYGSVNLYGKSLQERAKLLIRISHPDDREDLERAAFERYGRAFLLHN